MTRITVGDLIQVKIDTLGHDVDGNCVILPAGINGSVIDVHKVSGMLDVESVIDDRVVTGTVNEADVDLIWSERAAQQLGDFVS